MCESLVNEPRSRVERLPPSQHVKEPSATAHYEHYAHDDEWSIGDLLPSIPLGSRGFVYIYIYII
jgi:hypothetical protein